MRRAGEIMEWWESGGNWDKPGRDLLYKYLVEVLTPLGLDDRILVHDYVCRREKQPEEEPPTRIYGYTFETQNF